MKEKFFDKGGTNYLKQTKELLNEIKQKCGLQAFLFSRKMLLAAWYSGIKPDTEYISYAEVLQRTKRLMKHNQYVTLKEIKEINYCSEPHGLFFGVPRKTILEGNINDVIIQAQEYYNTPTEVFDELDEDE